MGLGRATHALMRLDSLMSKLETVSWLLTTSVARRNSREARERFPVRITVVKLVISTACDGSGTPGGLQLSASNQLLETLPTQVLSAERRLSEHPRNSRRKTNPRHINEPKFNAQKDERQLEKFPTDTALLVRQGDWRECVTGWPQNFWRNLPLPAVIQRNVP